MKIILDEKECAKHKLTLQELLMALVVKSAVNVDSLWRNMVNRNILIRKDKRYIVTEKWDAIITALTTSGCSRSDEELLELAVKVQSCFPQMKMKDRLGRETPYYYRCNKSEVAKALKRFFTQYGEDYTDEDIVDATKRYVSSCSKNNYSGMRLAKYFIMKNPIKQGEDGTGYVEQVSDLLTFLENKEETKIVSGDDWLLTSRN